VPVFGGRDRDPSQVTVVGKRAIDIALGSVLALIALPFLALLALTLFVLTRGNPFFVQFRPGHDGGSFRILKLRTLPRSTPHYASKQDLQIGEMGLPWLCALLRRTHLDELPQLLLVPIGTMSLVGPRPRQANEVEGIDADFDALRRQARPGCTGLWQISTASSALLRDAPPFDLFYLQRASLRLDVWIMLRTVAMVLGLAKPVEIDDVPNWVRGGGLLPRSAFIRSVRTTPAQTEPVSVPAPAPALEPHVIAPLPAGPGLLANTPERILAEA
jgi:lipopolysaccharide/colanic/teichoic acid biosynthesis glycosyltransferase